MNGMAAHAPEQNVYLPGELAPVSGIYRVEHLRGHRDAHLAVIIRGEELPTCRTCKEQVTYTVVQMTSHVTHDWDFTAPNGLSVRPPGTEYAELRAFPRRELEVAIEVELAEKAEILHGQTANISEGGVCAYLDQGLSAEDALVTLRFRPAGVLDAIAIAAIMRYRSGNRHGFFFVDPGANTREIVRSMLRAGHS